MSGFPSRLIVVRAAVETALTSAPGGGACDRGLDWDPACLDFTRADRAVWTASAGQVRRPLYAGSVGRAKSYEPQLGPLLVELQKNQGERGDARN